MVEKHDSIVHTTFTSFLSIVREKEEEKKGTNFPWGLKQKNWNNEEVSPPPPPPHFFPHFFPPTSVFICKSQPLYTYESVKWWHSRHGNCCLLITFIYSTILHSWADSLCSQVILNEWLAFNSAFLNIHWGGVLTELFGWCMAGAVWNCCHATSLHARPDA